MFEIRNAKITGMTLGIEDHGFLTSWITLDYGSSCQAFGGYVLTNKTTATWIRRVLEVVGCEKWENILGKPVRVSCEHVKVHAIGNFLDEIWFNPSEEFNDGD